MLNLNFDWSSETYMLRQDEIQGITEVLNAINTGIGGSSLVIPDTYAYFSDRLTQVNWTCDDNFPVGPSGEVSHLRLYIYI